MSVLGANVSRWVDLSRIASAQYRVPPSWILAVIKWESGGIPEKISPTGFRGLMQVGKAVTTDWAKAEGTSSPWPDVMLPSVNILIGSWFLAWCSRRVAVWCPQGHPDHAKWIRACYGWGPGNLAQAVRGTARKIGHTPSFAELEAHNPDAGRNPAGGWFVRPWHSGKGFAADVARIEAEDPSLATVPSSSAGPSVSPGAAAAAGWAALSILGVALVLLTAAGIAILVTR